MSANKAIQYDFNTLRNTLAIILVVTGLTACSSALATSDSVLQQSSRTVENTKLSLSPSPIRSRTVPPTKTPTTTSTSMPTTLWNVPVIEIADWPGVVYGDYIQWKNNESIQFWDYDSPFSVNAVTGLITPEPTSTPYRYDQVSTISQSKDYEIHCLPNGLEMYRKIDQSLISQTSTQVYDCESIQWSNNGIVASLISDQGGVYIWPSDGTLPYLVGKTTPYTRAVWSPDDKKLLVFNFSQNADDGTFDVAFTDGRPMKNTGAVIEAGNGWELDFLKWSTDDIVINMRQCGDAGACQSYAYYDAMTGKYLIGYIVDSRIQEGQEALLSPNNRWLSLDTYMDEDVWGKRYSYENRVMVIYDLKAHRKYAWAKGDDSIRFVDWSPDSDILHFVHFPFDNQNTDMPTGYLSIRSSDLHPHLVIPNVLTVKPSPGGEIILVGMSEGIKEQRSENVTMSLYTIDGHQLSKSQLVAEQLDYETPQMVNIPVSWSNDSSKVALVDASGNLWVFAKDGRITQIASSLPTELWPDETYIKWSPDNTRLLVTGHNRAWIAVVP